MGLHLKTPDEQGWYWVKDRDDNWFMAFVDTSAEEVCFWDEQRPFHNPFICDFESTHLGGCIAWYGPFVCPGGDFGGDTVVACEEHHERAKKEKKVIGITHFDFRYCRDEHHGASLTVTGVYTREEAEKRIGLEVADVASNPPTAEAGQR